jgi:hypothetical protein
MVVAHFTERCDDVLYVEHHRHQGDVLRVSPAPPRPSGSNVWWHTRRHSSTLSVWGEEGLVGY